MARSVPDDDMMDEQQARDLGHPTKSPPWPNAGKPEGQPANGSGTSVVSRSRQGEAEAAIRRAAYQPKHWK